MSAIAGGPAAPRAKPSPWTPWIAGAFVALVASVLHWLMAPAPLLHGLSDEALLVPLGLRTVGAAPYANDTWLDLAQQVFSVPYSYLVGWVTAPFPDDPVGGLRLLALPFLAVFVGGVWALAQRQSGSDVAAAVAVGALLLPVLLTEPVLVEALSPAVPPIRSRLEQMTLAPGAALPRDLVFALFPLAWMAGWWAWERGAFWVAGVGAGLGLLANVHPLTALHAAGLFLLCGLIEKRSGAGFGQFLAGTAGFVLGAAPFVFQYLYYPVTDGVPPADVLAWRVDGIGGESWTRWAGRMEPFFWMGLGALLLVKAVDVERSLGETRLLRGAGVAVVLAGAGPFVTNAVPMLQGFQPDRLGRFAAVLLIVLCARLGWLAARRGGGAVVGIAAALFLLVVLNPVVVRLAVGGGGQRGPFEVLARKLERHLGEDRKAAVPDGVVSRTRPADPSAPRTPAEREDFLSVSAFARDETPPEAKFIVPPESLGSFRVYGRRAVTVTRKSGGFCLSFLGGRGNDWFAAYRTSLATYAGGDAAAWADLARETGATHVLLDGPADVPAGWETVLETPTYTVLSVR